MGQKILIITGTVLILAACGIWIYLLFFGTPEHVDELFANLSSGDIQERDFIPSEAPEDASLALGDAALEQITTRPVAGFAFVTDGATTSSPHIVYAERGTGHIYEVDLAAETEKRVLGITYAGITDAAFADDGSAVVLTALNGYEHATYLEEIPERGGSDVSHDTFPSDAASVEFVGREVRYTQEESIGRSGHAYDRDDQTIRTMFTVPLSDIAVDWSATRTLLHPKPAPALLGALYRVDGTTFTRIVTPAYALSAKAHPTQERYLITSVDTKAGTLASVVRESGGTTATLPISALPEKCAFAVTTDALWCAAPVEAVGRDFQTAWYKGTIQPRDIIWRVDVREQSATVLVDPLIATGRTIDVTDAAVVDDALFAFINKVDGTLWIYRLPDTGANTTEKGETATSSASR